MKRRGTAEEVAAFIFFVLFDESGYTGAEVAILQEDAAAAASGRQ
jgi:hypothetical protein